MPDTPTILRNARIVLPEAVIRGWLRVEDGVIAAYGEGDAPAGNALDLDGDLLIPGLVELHTDHLESHYAPRPKVRWHSLGAVLAYDAQIAASGITTVFDSLRAGTDNDGGGLGGELLALTQAIGEARRGDLLRAEHRTHLRCEIPSPDVVEVVESYCAHFPVDLISLMDHTPGQRQFRDVKKYVSYAQRSGKSLEEIQALTAERMITGAGRAARNRPKLVEIVRQRSIPLASHDDTTANDVAQSAAEGATVAEFPTTIEAAARSRAGGITVLMGAPNLIRGGSHSGNVAAQDLAREGLLDILSSDYVPASLLMAALQLPAKVPGIALPQAIATVTANPAAATRLQDRGRITAGLRADLARVQVSGTEAMPVPVVRQVWRGGRRVV